MKDNDEIYIVIDIEADGPVPGQYSMLSIGAVATTGKEEVGIFSAQLLPLKGASQHQATMEWWKSQPEAWKAATENQKPPQQVMQDFCEWLKGFDGKLIVTAHPIGFDYSFVSWYLWKYINENPFADSNGAVVNLDIASFVSGSLHLKVSDSTRTKMPEMLKKGMPEHNHNALDDARGFAVILRNILAE